MDEPELELDEVWTDEGVRFALEQPVAVRRKRANVWLFGLIGMAVALVPIALSFLFLPALTPYTWIAAPLFPLVFGWAGIPPIVITRLNRPTQVEISADTLTVGEQVFERGTVRGVTYKNGRLDITHDGSSLHSTPCQPVDTERVLHLLNSVAVSEDEAAAEQVHQQEALRRLRPLRQRGVRS